MREKITQLIQDSIQTKQDLLQQIDVISSACSIVINVLQRGNKVLICGNGGSAADSQHFAAELVCRFETERSGLPAIALTTDTSIMTAWTNDYTFDTLFSRQVQALGKSGDVLVGLSTSGNSENVMRAFDEAKKKGMHSIALTGNNGGKIAQQGVDVELRVHSFNTARIQESHILFIHIMCSMVDQYVDIN